jgi:subtilisin family serine protease
MQLLACLTLAASCCLAVANSLVLPKAYYVRLSKDSAELTPDTIVAKAAESSVTVQVRHEFYDESIFYGASVVLKDDDVEKIRALPGVENVFPVPLVKFDRPTMPGMNTTKGTFFDKRNEQRAFNKCAGARVDWNSPHAMTGVDKLHAEGIFGDGVRIAILDTGIDYLNPALGGCFGKGCKVEFGYDYVGDEYGVIDYVLRPKPDPRPECYEGFHGTHVAGIVGMEVPSNATKFAGLMGVAPRATLGMYRVIACVNIDGGDDVILAALQRAVDDGADVVSMSFEVFAWTMGRFSPLPAAVAALKAKGIAVIASAGNYGARGMFNIVLPGGSESAVAVASVENSKFPTYPISDSNGAEFRYAALYPFGTGEYPVAWAGNDDNVARSGCSASDYPPPSSLSEPISNYIVAVRRGVECGLDRIQTLATAANYTRVVTYVDPTHNEISMKAYGLPTPMLDSNGFDFPFATTADGNLFEASEKPGSYRLLVRSQAPLLVEQPGGISPNNFSSVGRTLKIYYLSRRKV